MLGPVAEEELVLLMSRNVDAMTNAVFMPRLLARRAFSGRHQARASSRALVPLHHRSTVLRHDVNDVKPRQEPGRRPRDRRDGQAAPPLVLLEPGHLVLDPGPALRVDLADHTHILGTLGSN